MAKNKTYKKIIEHIDREEIISKLLIGISEEDIYDWLAAKYSSSSEAKFVISKSSLKSFKNIYLDFYQDVINDINNAKKQVKTGEITTSEDLKLIINNTSAYKEMVLNTVSTELDIRSMVKNLCNSLEIRYSAIFDSVMSDPDTIDLRRERILGELGLTLSSLLEKYYKFTEAPSEATTQINTFNISTVDKYSAALTEAIREILSELDIEASLLFMEKISSKLALLQPPSDQKISQNKNLQQENLLEVKILNETIAKKLNETN